MHLIYEALKKTNGDADGEKLIGAMKGMAWESPRGPISIDPETRDIVQNIYMRKVEKVNGDSSMWSSRLRGGQGPDEEEGDVSDEGTTGRSHAGGAQGAGARAQCALPRDHGRVYPPHA